MKNIRSLNKKISNIISKLSDKYLLNKKSVEKDLTIPNDYFSRAESWADDMHTSIIASRNRYRFFLYLAIGLITLLIVNISFLIPIQHIEPLLVHHFNDGRVNIERMSNTATPSSRAQVESDLVRYTINRESFDPIAYDYQYKLVQELSSESVSKSYSESQSATNDESPINLYGKKYFVSTHVDNVLFLDNENLNKNKKNDESHHNLAQINYIVSLHDVQTGKITSKPYAALISWDYVTPSKDSERRWLNWNGFQVTKFSRTQRSL